MIYSISQRSTSVTTGTPAWEIRAAAASKPRLMELGITIAAATASTFGLGRPAAVGVTPTFPVTVLDESDGAGPAGQTQVAFAWATAPTSPVNFFRRIGLPATTGTGIIFTFPRGLGIPAGTSLVVWNLATNAANIDFWAVVDE